MKRKLEENKYYQYGLTAFCVIAASIIFYFLIFKVKEIWNLLGTIIALFTPFIVGFAFAYLLNPIVKFFRENLFIKMFKNSKKNEKEQKKIANNISILFTCVLAIGLIVLLFSFILPELLKSIESIAINLPNYITDIKNYLIKKVNDSSLQNVVINNYKSINDYINNICNIFIILICILFLIIIL